MFRAVSLFSGCGGMDLGFAGAGFEVVRAIDLDPAAAAVHAANFGAPAVRSDVTGTDFAAWRRELGPVDVVLGGFPCQGFSKAGPKRADDPRNGLYRAMLGAVRELRPACFVAENVEGLAQNFGGRYLEQISGDFGRLGYQVAVALIDAIGYSVPQHRRRIFFVGTAAGMAPAAGRSRAARSGCATGRPAGPGRCRLRCTGCSARTAAPPRGARHRTAGRGWPSRCRSARPSATCARWTPGWPTTR